MIEIDDLAFAFDEQPVIRDLSLTVASGELVGLIGPNGAGKTTLIRLINGALAPDTGAIRIDGAAVAELSSRAVSRRVAVVPQDTSLSFDFSVRDVVAMGRHPHLSRLDRLDASDRDLVEQAMRRTGTASLADRPFSAISGGERKRVTVARALAQDAPYLLVDEPTASLDINHQLAVFDLLCDLVADDRAILTAVHDLNLAARFCDRLALLHEGTVRAVGSPAEVLQPSLLEATYGVETTVVTNPVSDTPMVIAGTAPHAVEREGAPTPFPPTRG